MLRAIILDASKNRTEMGHVVIYECKIQEKCRSFLKKVYQTLFQLNVSRTAVLSDAKQISTRSLNKLTLTLDAGGEATGHRLGAGNNVFCWRGTQIHSSKRTQCQSHVQGNASLPSHGKQISHSLDSNDGIKERYEKYKGKTHLCLMKFCV